MCMGVQMNTYTYGHAEARAWHQISSLIASPQYFLETVSLNEHGTRRFGPTKYQSSFFPSLLTARIKVMLCSAQHFMRCAQDQTGSHTCQQSCYWLILFPSPVSNFENYWSVIALPFMVICFLNNMKVSFHGLIISVPTYPQWYLREEKVQGVTIRNPTQEYLVLYPIAFRFCIS